jgi:Domain of unknown function DUF11
VTAASAAAPTFVAFTATVGNAGKSSLTQTTVTACLVAGSGEECGTPPPGAFLRSAEASQGTCTVEGATAQCELGKLRRGAEATVDFVAGAPTEPGDFGNLVSAFVKERRHDKQPHDPNPDTVTVSTPVSVLPVGGPRASSFVPEGVAAELLAGQDGQTGQSKIPTAHENLTAQLEITEDPPFVCPKHEICRGGGWVSATIPGEFDALQFVLHWPKQFVSRKQTEKNFVLFYLACDTCDLEMISDRCSSPTPSAAERPCLWDIRLSKYKGLGATLITSHNGKMH